MGDSTFVKQQISYDLANKDFISVDIGTSSTPNVLQIPVFKNNTQFKFINDGQTIYSPENLYYMDTYSQRWNNAPNVITMFIQDACCIGVKPNVTTAGTTYVPMQTSSFSSTQREKIAQGIFEYFSSNSGPVLYTGDDLNTKYPFGGYAANSISSITSGINVLGGTPSNTKHSHYIAKGNESSGTLSSFFKRPNDEELNPTGILNLAQGNYPYNNENIIQNYEIQNWVGEWKQLLTSGVELTNNVRLPGFDAEAGVYISVVNIANEPFGSSFSTETNTSIPRFYEPIDYFVMNITSYTSNTGPMNIYALYRRVYFGVQPFNL